MGLCTPQFTDSTGIGHHYYSLGTAVQDILPARGVTIRGLKSQGLSSGGAEDGAP